MRMSGAIRARRRVAFRYKSHSGDSSRRELEPYGVVYMDGRWYVAGHCLLRRALRTFRLDRVSELEIGDATFIRPEGFDTRTYLYEVMPLVQTTYNVDVWLALPLDQARGHFALHRVAMSEENGGTVIRCGRDSLEMFGAVLLSLGCRIEVRSPHELKETFGRLSARAAEAAAGYVPTESLQGQ